MNTSDRFWNSVGDYNRKLGDYSTALARAEVNFARKDFDNALLDLNFYLEKYVDSIEALTMRAIVLQRISNFEQALVDYESIFKLEPDNKNFERIFQYVSCLYETNKVDKALKEIDKIIINDKKYILAYFLKGSLLILAKQFDKAFYYYTKTIEFDDQFGDAHAMNGQCRYMLEDWNSAIFHFEKVISLGLNLNMQLRLQYGIALCKIGQKIKGTLEIKKSLLEGNEEANYFLKLYE